SRLFSSTFFALRDTGTPARIATVRVVTSALLGLFLMIQFEPVTIFGRQLGPGVFAGFDVGGRPLGAFGLALSAGIASWMEWILLRRALRRRIGRVGAGLGPLARMFAAALLAAGAGWAVRAAAPPVHPVLLALLVFVPFGLVY